MVKRVGVVVVWLLATLGTASLTYAAVSRAGGAVGENPAVPVAASDIAARVPTTLSATSPSTTGAIVLPDAATTTLGTAPPTSTTTVASGTATSTTSLTTGEQPTTTTTQPSTTTTQPSIRTEWKTVEGVGTVGVSVQGDRLAIVSATPIAPFRVDGVETEGDSIEVYFKSESAEYRIRADLEDGVLVWGVEDHN